MTLLLVKPPSIPHTQYRIDMYMYIICDLCIMRRNDMQTDELNNHELHVNTWNQQTPVSAQQASQCRTSTTENVTQWGTRQKTWLNEGQDSLLTLKYTCLLLIKSKNLVYKKTHPLIIWMCLYSKKKSFFAFKIVFNLIL